MATDPSSIFLHAFRPDGTVYSICRRCQSTVASKTTEGDLIELENSHVCSALSLHRLFYSDEMNRTDE